MCCNTICSLINSVNYAPELVGIGKYTGEMAKWLAEHGHDVKVVTAPPYYPDWKISTGYSALGYKSEIIDNVNRRSSRKFPYRIDN